MNEDNILLEIKNLTKSFYKRKIFSNKLDVKAVDNISFRIKYGETIGLLGESGSGKSTLGKIIVKVMKPDSGDIYFRGLNISNMNDKEFWPLRKELQMIFQDPYSSLDNCMNVGKILQGGIRTHKICEKKDESEFINYLLDIVGLDKSDKNKYPYEFSGGQCQRIGIARAISLKPKFIVCDEATSGLDVVAQHEIISMLKEIKNRMNISYIFISHNISAIKDISDKVCVMYYGRFIEYGSVKSIYNNPLHPYTQKLISHDEKICIEYIRNNIPNFCGCPFFLNCKYSMDICKEYNPVLKEIDKCHFVACHLY